MPELPEVETARRYIATSLAGKQVASVEVRLQKLLRDSPLPDLSVLTGSTLLAVDRRAKILILHFDTDLSLLAHFKLAGQIAIVLPNGERKIAGHPVPDPAGPYPHKSTHIIFRFTDGTIAHFSDVRQFGWFRLMPTDSVQAAIAEFGFGPEGTTALDEAALAPVFDRHAIPVKALLLDQSFVAGLGNIYADETLFRARVHPATPARDVSTGKRRAILRAIPEVLAMGIAQGGAKIVNHRARPVNDFPAVHAREGEPCFRCGSIIVKTRVASRGTYFCPTCQKAPPGAKARIRAATPARETSTVENPTPG